jgi:integrase
MINRCPDIKKHHRGLKFPELRHMHITFQIGNGIDFKTVWQRAGHRKTSTTMEIYTHAIPANDRVAADLMGSLLRKEG